MPLSLVFVKCLMQFPLLCAYYTGESSVEVKIEADSNDITEHPHDDKQRSYLCTVCDKRFKSREGLRYHKLTAHSGGNSHLCTQCNKCFPNQQCLRIHMNIHSSKYKCTECGKCFRNNLHLSEHRRSHSGEKPFECSVCSKRFRTAGHLVVHSRIHSGEKTYKCHMCNNCLLYTSPSPRDS